MLRHSAAILAVLALTGCGADEAVEEKAPPPAVEIARVAAGAAADIVTATGSLEREREMTLSFRIPGVIRTLTVDDGDPVAAGRVVASIDPTTVDAGARRAAADLDRARRDLARDQQLADKGYVSRQRLDDRKSALDAAQAGYDAAAFDRRWASLVSPVSGVVLARRAQAGEVVQPGQPVVVVADEGSPLVLRVSVPDRDAPRVVQGAPATVRIGADSLPGVVSRIGRQVAAGTGVVEVEIRIPARADLRSGLIATAEISATPAGGAASAFARVPAEAILEASNGKAFVFRLDERAKAARRTPVGFGGFSGDDALVSGLPAGSAVITAGAGYLADGQAVSVVDPAILVAGARE